MNMVAFMDSHLAQIFGASHSNPLWRRMESPCELSDNTGETETKFQDVSPDSVLVPSLLG